jgi:uncharacterized membrane protein
MKAIGFVAGWVMVCLAGALACGSDDADEAQAGGACDAAPSFDEVTAFTQVCTNCHDSSLGFESRNGAPLGYDFDEYETASSEAPEIKIAVEQGYMPPPGYTISEEQKAQVISWVDCGAPE